jgi:WD40 repeat protein
MTEPVSCPDPARWEELLSAELPPEKQFALGAHLESCPSCQQTLERLAAGSETWSGAARHLGEGGRVGEAALQRVVAELEGEEVQPPTQAESDLGEELNLDFLSPAEKPELLGRLGHYEVLEVIGRGGMGVVLKAFDQTLQRVVAIKVLASSLATSATARRRFVREAQAAAAVRNEHVIDIHAVEGAGERPYLVMEYISGVSLQQRLDRTGPLEVKEVLRIGLQTAAGLAAAHAQGLVHRDIKPANILLENGVERVKITDFGLARAVDDASLTQSGTVAGTPQYMAPEQARGEAVDHRADLFSLGSVLYALCTGRAPFRASGTMAVLKRVCEDTPRPIQEINPEVPNWLAAIITRLHAKEPAERLQSAAEVAELLSAHLAPLQQTAVLRMPRAPRSPSRRVHASRWRVVAAALALLLGGLGLTEATGVTRIAATVMRILTPDGTLVVEVEDPNVKVTIEGDGGLVITGAGPQEVRLRPGSYRVRADKDGKPIQTELVTISRGDKQVVRVSLEAAGLARSAFEFKPPPPGPLDRLDPARIPATERFPWQPKELVAVLGEHRAQQWAGVRCVTYSRDGKQVASCGEDKNIYLWDAGTLRLRRLLQGHTAPIWSVAFSPDGRRLLSGAEDKTVRLWDLETGKELHCLEGHTQEVWSVAYSPDGRRALSGGADQIVRLWDLDGRKELGQFRGHAGIIGSVAFSPDGSQVLSGSYDNTMRLWEVKSGQEIRCLTGHEGNFRIVRFLPNGLRALSCSHDKTLRLWDLKTGDELRRFNGHTREVFYVAVSSDGRRALSSGDDGIRFWNVDTGEQLWSANTGRRVSSVALSPDGRRALSGGGNDLAVRQWELPRGQELDPPMGVRDVWWPLSKIVFSPDRRRVLSSYASTYARLWDVESGREMHCFSMSVTIRCVSFSPDGREAICAGGSGMVVWDADSGKELRRFERVHGLYALVCSSDGGRVLTGGSHDPRVALWDVESGRELCILRGHTHEVLSVDLSPDNRYALSGGKDGTVRLWDLAEGHELHRLGGHAGHVLTVAFSPDGRSAASGDADGFVRLWDLTETKPRMRALPRWHTGRVYSVAFSPDGKSLVSSGQDGRIILWDAAAGTKWREWQFPGFVPGVAFASDARHLATANGNGTIYILRLPGSSR